jgi:hypothetical protein
MIQIRCVIHVIIIMRQTIWHKVIIIIISVQCVMAIRIICIEVAKAIIIVIVSVWVLIQPAQFRQVFTLIKPKISVNYA